MRSAILYIYIAGQGDEDEFVEVHPGINIELDKEHQIIGMEIMRASEVLRDVIEPLRQKVKP